jgi:hypothetical protein
MRPEFRLNPDNLFVPLTVNSGIVLERIVIPEIPIEELVTRKVMKPQIEQNGEPSRRPRISGPHEFEVSFQPYVNKAEGACPLCLDP